MSMYKLVTREGDSHCEQFTNLINNKGLQDIVSVIAYEDYEEELEVCEQFTDAPCLINHRTEEVLTNYFEMYKVLVGLANASDNNS